MRSPATPLLLALLLAAARRAAPAAECHAVRSHRNCTQLGWEDAQGSNDVCGESDDHVDVSGAAAKWACPAACTKCWAPVDGAKAGSSDCVKNGGCVIGSYAASVQICEAVGARLCTLRELTQECVVLPVLVVLLVLVLVVQLLVLLVLLPPLVVVLLPPPPSPLPLTHSSSSSSEPRGTGCGFDNKRVWYIYTLGSLLSISRANPCR